MFYGFKGLGFSVWSGDFVLGHQPGQSGVLGTQKAHYPYFIGLQYKGVYVGYLFKVL